MDGLEEALDELVDAIRAVGGRLELVRGEWSVRGLAEATLSILWSDLIEVKPERLARAWGVDLPQDWEELHASLLQGVASARAAVEGRRASQ